MKVGAKFYNTQTGKTETTYKPSGQQKRKHQINQLAYQAKLQNLELLSKRSAGYKTKAQTHAKYGW